MSSATFTVRVDAEIKERLEALSRSTGRTRSYLAAEAIGEYLDVNEWQVRGIEAAKASLDAGDAVAHKAVKAWVESWDDENERPRPKRSRR